MLIDFITTWITLKVVFYYMCELNLFIILTIDWIIYQINYKQMHFYSYE